MWAHRPGVVARGEGFGGFGGCFWGGAPMVKRGGVGCGRTARRWWGAGRALGVLGGVFGGGAPMVNPWVLWVVGVVAVLALVLALPLPATAKQTNKCWGS